MSYTIPGLRQNNTINIDEIPQYVCVLLAVFDIIQEQLYSEMSHPCHSQILDRIWREKNLNNLQEIIIKELKKYVHLQVN